LIKNITLISPGEMGSPIAEYIISSGIKVISPLNNRSEETKNRSIKSGIENSNTLIESMKQTDLIISILVPSEAENLCKEIAKYANEIDKEIYFADLNAISPKSVQNMKNILLNTKIKFIDGGIIGGPPTLNKFPRVYVSGTYSKIFMELNNLGMDVIDMSGDIGDASAIKMAYASITKGYSSLLIAAITLAIKTDNFDIFMKELEFSQPTVFNDIKNLKSIPSKAHRWIGEMTEISNTFIDNGVSGNFHKGSFDIYTKVSNSNLGRKRLSPNEITLDGKEFFKNIQ
jgi:6-phosphogluconate dehydrogenase (decarboxylating)|tara:strand:+ start:6421 stop:7281 length:861 start_codon:yes stop_codon:yes gene_type:complete